MRGQALLLVLVSLAVSGCGLTLGRTRSPMAGAATRPAAGSGAATVSTGSAGSGATAASAGSAGSGAPDASAGSAGSAAAAQVARADRTHEVPTPAPRQTALGGWRTPVQAVEVFAATYINWTAATVSARLRALAEVSVGQARSALSLAAGETVRDSALQRGGIANSGVVEAIGPVRGRDDQYAVVTRELTTAANTSAYRGLQAAWHVSLATVTQIRGGLWVLSAWQPEN